MKHRRAILPAIAALLLFCVHGILCAQSGQQTPDEPGYLSRLPEKYNVIIERNMFGFFPRENIAVSQTADQGTAPVSSQTPRLPDTLVDFQHDPGINSGAIHTPGPSFSLTAVVQVDAARKAIIVDNAAGDGFYVAEGDSINGYTVVKIAGDRAVLQKGTQSLIVTIDVPRPPSTLVPNTAAPQQREAVPAPDIQRLPPHVQPRIGH